MTNKRTNQRQKTIYFNTDDQIEEKLFEYSKVVGGRNFSGWVKSLIYKELQARGGEVPNPFEYLNAYSEGTQQSAVGVEVQVEPAPAPKARPKKKEAPKRVVKPEPVVEEEPEMEEEDFPEEVKEEVREEAPVEPEEEREPERPSQPKKQNGSDRSAAASNFLSNMRK